MSQAPWFSDEEKAKVIEKVLEGLRSGLPEYKAATEAGCSFMTWFRWREDSPALKERARDARKARIPLIHDALYKAALKGSVSACLAILDREDPDWEQRGKDPQAPVLIFQGGASVLIGSLDSEKKRGLLTALVTRGLLPQTVIDIQPGKNGAHYNGNGTNGSSNGSSEAN